MLLFELSKEQYLETMHDKMTNITENAEPVTDIWDYVEQLRLDVDNAVSSYDLNNKLVEAVYRNSDNSFHHIITFTDKHNVFIVIVVDVNKRVIYGHYLLNLNEEYSL